MKRSLRIGTIVLSICVVVFVIFQLSTSNERVSEKFASNLFEYPLPPHTTLIAKHQFNGKNFLDGGGSGGYWNVVAIMELSSSLPRDEIIEYYKRTEAFPYPKSKNRGVELELYFDGESKRMEESRYKLFYFRDQEGRMQPISRYSSDTTVSSKTQSDTKFTIQLASGFDYFLNID
ncbi:hypothetical protein [Paenibacillus sp. NPDC058071]|uniref:hypothetical protein n=1 Tax=Paenibacillus sp. NPDC058071 TaxID=3346326 RepID=UPI0036D90B70